MVGLRGMVKLYERGDVEAFDKAWAELPGDHKKTERALMRLAKGLEKMAKPKKPKPSKPRPRPGY